MISPLLRKVGSSGESSTNVADSVNGQSLLLNYIPRAARREPREASPDLIELQAQIELLRYLLILDANIFF